MAVIVEAVMEQMTGHPRASSMDDVFKADEEARSRAAALIAKSAAA
jgi:1-deoxy-D-xylulose-5-phosphate reductoisomerase